MDDRKRAAGYFVASEDAARLAEQVVAHVDAGVGADWYAEGNDADLAAFTLCRLRRARAGVGGGPRHGDEAVRAALEQVSPEALVWVASRAISYMDETGFPEAVEHWFRSDDEIA